jgi:hypothetical protein
MKLPLTLTLLCALCVPTAHAQITDHAKEPLGSLAAGWTYLWSDQGADYRSNLNGWFVRPSVNVGRGYAIFFSNTNHYGHNAKGEINSHGFTLGLSKQVFTRPHIRPSIFLEAGDVRGSSHGITHQAVVATGFGLAFPLNHRVSLVLTPAEYVFKYPHADWRNDYNAKVGLSFPFGHK